MGNLGTFELDNELLLEIDEATIEDFQDLEESDWKTIEALEKFDLDIDEEI